MGGEGSKVKRRQIRFESIIQFEVIIGLPSAYMVDLEQSSEFRLLRARGGDRFDVHSCVETFNEDLATDWSTASDEVWPAPIAAN